MGQKEEMLSKALSLLQKKYGALEEIYSLTGQMEDALSRKDEVSFQLLLKMRAEEMARVEQLQEQLWQPGEGDLKENSWYRRLLSAEFLEEDPGDPQEARVKRIRLSTQRLIEKIQGEDRKLNVRMAGKKSWYQARREPAAGGKE